MIKKLFMLGLCFVAVGCATSRTNSVSGIERKVASYPEESMAPGMECFPRAKAALAEQGRTVVDPLSPPSMSVAGGHATYFIVLNDHKVAAIKMQLSDCAVELIEFYSRDH